MERFNRTVLDELLRAAFRQKYCESVDALQEDVNTWLKHYNEERTHQGYRNMGKLPIDTVTASVHNVRTEA